LFSSPSSTHPLNLVVPTRIPPKLRSSILWWQPWIDAINLDTMAIAMGWHKPDNVAGSSAPAIMVGLFVASGGLLFGYDTG
jgi:hypothetical protein